MFFTKKQIQKIQNIKPSEKVLKSKEAHKAFEEGQIEGLE